MAITGKISLKTGDLSWLVSIKQMQGHMVQKRQERNQKLVAKLHDDLRALVKWHIVAIASVDAYMTNVQGTHCK